MATTTPFTKSERLQKLPPYLFAEIDKKKKAAIAAGRDVINLGVGDPDRPTPEPIIKSLQQNVENPAFHQYALDQGAPSYAVRSRPSSSLGMASMSTPKLKFFR